MSEREIAYKTMESIMNISIAGFGGALCGLAVSRRGGLSPVLSRVGSTATSKATTSARTPYYIDHELPTAWAVSCITFASIVEFSRLTSPATKLLALLKGKKLNNKAENPVSTEGSTKEEDSSLFQKYFLDSLMGENLPIVLDYTFGGAAAGAIFKGSVIRSQAAKRLASRGVGVVVPSSAIAARTGILAGLIPGAALGFFAGVIVYMTIQLKNYTEQKIISQHDQTTE
mmetsp:Transcript_4667/g.6911  ORF Transcript_4667/g.6911 Transcript_4667/m.6911 type:complete len:229 (-) Transcript_4667:339-1025(-)